MALILPNTIANQTPADGDKLQQNFGAIVDWGNQEAITADGSTAMVSPLLLPGPPTQPNQAATKEYVDSSTPIGVMYMYAGDTAPTNWMICQGQALSRSTYATLFSIIGIRFGAGDTTTTFNLPDMRSRLPVGANPGGGNGPHWQGGPGQVFGQAAAVLAPHTHPGVDHLHNLNINTNIQDTNHYHATNIAGVNYVGVGPAGAGIGASAGGTTFRSMTTTDWQSHDHKHLLSGNTGAADRSLTTGSTGSDPLGAGNYPPGVSFHFVMKVL
jgi:microcystin-dependent protein